MNRLSFSVLTFIIMIGPTVGCASDTTFDRQSLKGIKGVKVIVEDMEPEVEQAGLTKDAIQTDVELKLRQAGIPILKGDDSELLSVGITVLTDPSGVWNFELFVEVEQAARLVRDPSIIVAGTTWRLAVFGNVSRSNIRSLRDNVKDYIDRFINAYLSVNSK